MSRGNAAFGVVSPTSACLFPGEVDMACCSDAGLSDDDHPIVLGAGYSVPVRMG